MKLVPKLRLGTHVRKLCFQFLKQSFRDLRAQAELGHEVGKSRYAAFLVFAFALPGLGLGTQAGSFCWAFHLS